MYTKSDVIYVDEGLSEAWLTLGGRDFRYSPADCAGYRDTWGVLDLDAFLEHVFEDMLVQLEG